MRGGTTPLIAQGRGINPPTLAALLDTSIWKGNVYMYTHYFAGFPCEPSFFWGLSAKVALIFIVGAIVSFYAYSKASRAKYIYAAVIMLFTLLICAYTWRVSVPFQCQYPFFDNFKSVKD